MTKRIKRKRNTGTRMMKGKKMHYDNRRRREVIKWGERTDGKAKMHKICSRSGRENSVKLSQVDV